MEKNSIRSIAISVGLSCLLFVFMMFYISRSDWIRPNIYINEVQNARKVGLNDLLSICDQEDFIKVAEEIKSSTVYIKVWQKTEESSDLFSQNIKLQHGSGFIISEDGYIATNLHVVKNAAEIHVTLDDRREFQGRMIGEDSHTDIAVIKIECNDLPPVRFGDSNSLRLGQWVLAAGNPLRLQSSISAGIISALSRNINTMDSRGIESYIQTDLTANSGSSGGPLVNLRGELCGMITAVITETGTDGFTFAIPSNVIKKICRDLIAYGAAQRAWLGVETENMDAKKARELGVTEVKGVLVSNLEPESAAAKAGIQVGDILLKIDGFWINNNSQLAEKLALYYPGDQVELEILRKGQSQILTATLTNHLKGTDKITIHSGGIWRQLGIEIRELSKDELKLVPGGGIYVVSVSRNSVAWESNISPGLIITAANGKKIENISSIQSILETSPDSLYLEGRYVNFPGVFPYVIDIR